MMNTSIKQQKYCNKYSRLNEKSITKYKIRNQQKAVKEVARMGRTEGRRGGEGRGTYPDGEAGGGVGRYMQGQAEFRALREFGACHPCAPFVREVRV
jgi:hypothetical protein